MSLPVIAQKSWPDILARPEKNRVGMCCSLIGQRSDMQPTKSYICSPSAIMVGEFVSPVSRSDIHLNHHQLRVIVEIERLHMFILDGYLIIFIQIPGQRS